VRLRRRPERWFAVTSQIQYTLAKPLRRKQHLQRAQRQIQRATGHVDTKCAPDTTRFLPPSISRAAQRAVEGGGVLFNWPRPRRPGCATSKHVDVRSVRIRKLVDAAVAKWGRVDVVVVNTGHPPKAPPLSLSDEQWLSGYELILASAIRLARAQHRS
jgi:NAD(P)-dependent dehydrogenase (short-subunit alcohol dehydrogenase family)